MTREEISLLLYLETRSVDHSGRINSQHINSDDLDIIHRWEKEGFIEYGRICHADCTKDGSTWVHLSNNAIQAAHKARCAKAKRMWENKRYLTTKEINAKKTETIES